MILVLEGEGGLLVLMGGGLLGLLDAEVCSCAPVKCTLLRLEAEPSRAGGEMVLGFGEAIVAGSALFAFVFVFVLVFVFALVLVLVLVLAWVGDGEIVMTGAEADEVISDRRKLSRFLGLTPDFL